MARILTAVQSAEFAKILSDWLSSIIFIFECLLSTNHSENVLITVNQLNITVNQTAYFWFLIDHMTHESKKR